MTIYSPIIKSDKVKKICSFDIGRIISKWKASNIDVSRFFVGVKNVELYECTKSGYRFYYPFDLEGDDQFYQDLQKFDWYYFDWKWEYSQAMNLINPGQKSSGNRLRPRGFHCQA